MRFLHFVSACVLVTVGCGGENTTQSCIATLTRTGDVCN